MGQPTEREKKILYIKSNLDKYIEELKYATGLHIAIRSMLINGEEQCQTVNTTISRIILDSVYAITDIHPDDIKRKITLAKSNSWAARFFPVPAEYMPSE